MARTATSELVPVWRSDAQPVILHEVSLHVGLTAATISARHELNRATVASEVRRFVDAGVLIATPVGRANQLALNWSNPATTHLVALADITVGLLTELAGLYQVEGVQRVLVFGSWARRHHGEPGPPPGDIDVLVEIDGDPWLVEERTLAISGRRGVSVDPHIVTPGASDPITTAILAGPIVEVPKDERLDRSVPADPPRR